MKLADYRKIASALNADIEAAVKKHGLKLDRLRASIDESLGLVNLSVKLSDTNHKDETGAATDPERERYKRECAYIDLKPEWLGKSFSYGMKHYEIVGLKQRGKNCVVLKERPGERLKVAPPHMVKFGMEHNAVA